MAVSVVAGSCWVTKAVDVVRLVNGAGVVVDVLMVVIVVAATVTR